MMPAGGPSDPSLIWRNNVTSSDEGSLQVFRYTAALFTILLVVTFLSPIPAVLGYATSRNSPEGLSLYLFILAGLIPPVWLLYLYKRYKAFAVEVHNSYLLIQGLREPRRIDFSTVTKVTLVQGGGRGAPYVLSLFDVSGHKLISFTPPSIDNFEKLTVLIKGRAMAEGAKYRYCDVWGNWTA
jgi:hypothetical protein